MTSWIAYVNTDKPNPGCTVNFVEDVSSGEIPPLSVGDEIMCLFPDESGHKGKVVAGGDEYKITIGEKEYTIRQAKEPDKSFLFGTPFQSWVIV